MPTTPCISCSYSLTGLADDALCPECGAAVWRSTRGDLVDEPPRALRRLHAACILLLIDLFAGLATTAVFAVTAALSFGLAGYSLYVTWALLAAEALYGLSAAFACAGFLLIAHSAAPSPHPIRPNLARSTLNVVAVVDVIVAWAAVVSSVALVIPWVMHFDLPDWATDLNSRVARYGWPLVGVLHLTGWALALAIFRALARRAPDLAAARRARQAFVAVALLACVVIASTILHATFLPVSPATYFITTAAKVFVFVFQLRAVLALRRTFRSVLAHRLAAAAAPHPPLAASSS